MAKDAKGHGSDKRGEGGMTPVQSENAPFQSRLSPAAGHSYLDPRDPRDIAAQHGVKGPAVDAPDRLVGYVGKGGALTDWHGAQIGSLRVKSSWATPKSYVGSRMYSYEAQHKGATYHGRGFGEGMSLSLKRKK